MKAVVAAFNQEKALVGAFSVIVQPVVEPMERFAALGVTLALPNEATHAALPDSGLTDRNQFPNLIRANTKAAIIKRRKRPLPRPGHC